MHRGSLLITAVAILAACDGSGPVGQPSEESRVTLELLTVQPMLARPWGLALDPTGRYLVVSSHFDRQLYVLDAETYAPVGDTIGAGKVRGIVFAPAGTVSRMFVAGEGWGVLAGDVSPDGSLTLESLHTEYATFVLPDERTGGVYAVETVGLVRLAPDGSLLASRPLLMSANYGIATTRDGARVLALAYDTLRPRALVSERLRLLALDADDLTIVGEVDVPHWATQVVPLDGHRAVVVGGGHWWSPLVGPLVAVADWQEGTVGPTTELGADPMREVFDMGWGNPWVQVDPRTALIGTTHGILSIDTRTGETFHVVGDLHDDARVNECCSMVWDAGRRRLVIASGVVYPDNHREVGRLEVYRIR